MEKTAESTFEDILRQCLQEMYPRIVVSFDPKGFILDSLFAKKTITLKEKRQIAGLPAEERGAELIDTLLTCHRPNAIAQFLEILSNDVKTFCKWIHDEVHKAAQEKVASKAASSLESITSSILNAAQEELTSIATSSRGISSIPVATLPDPSRIPAASPNEKSSVPSLENERISVTISQDRGDSQNTHPDNGKYLF